MEPTEDDKLAAQLEVLAEQFGELISECTAASRDARRFREVERLIDDIEATLERLHERERKYAEDSGDR